ncbi:MAG: glycosyltransferase family 9 protein [Myxococcota bacterium]
MSIRQSVERFGRRLLIAVVSLLFGIRRRAVSIGESPAILVIRLDERVGNMLLLVPLLDSLRRRFPNARIDLLANVKARTLMEGHPALSNLIPFRKRALFAADGPLRTPWRLRRSRYDVAIDAANPTDPSATQSIVARLSGARHTIGPAHSTFARLYSAPVEIDDPEAHEIDLRLRLLAPLPGTARSRRVYLGDLPEMRPESDVHRVLAKRDGRRLAVLNVGARLSTKRLDADAYAEIATRLDANGFDVLVTFGPGERGLAAKVAALNHRVTMAPPTDLIELATLLRHANAVVTCDTGPMHVAVAVGTPTCGIFVSTPPTRYGHAEPPHRMIDARERDADAWLGEIDAWIADLEPTNSGATAGV